MPKANRVSTRPPTPAEIEAERIAGEQHYLAWSRRLINDARWNWQCPSRRCRRHGCQNAPRCEPQHRAGLRHIVLGLLEAQIEENSLRREVRESRKAAERGALLADARKREWLPIPELIR